MTTPSPQLLAARRILAAGTDRRRALLVSPFPLLVIETTPGSGAGTVLRDWAAIPDTPDLRVLLEADKVAAAEGQLLAAIVRMVTERAAGRAGDWTASASVAEVARAVTALRRPLTVAVLRADFLTVDVFRDLLAALSLRNTVQLVVAGFDCRRLMDQAQTARVPFRRITDEDLALSSAEIAARLTLARLPDDPASADRLRRRTGGLAGVVEAAIDLMADRAERGPEGHDATVDRGDIGGYLFSAGLQHWPSPLVAFVTEMAHIPRFSVGEANAIAQTTSARIFIDRMCALNLGRLAFHPELRQQVFTWFEPARVGTLGYLRHEGDPQRVHQRLRRTVSAAREAFDAALYLSSLVSLGRLDEAEQYLDEWLWDALPNGFSPVWGPLVAVGPAEFVDHPLLAIVRIRVEPRRDSAAVSRVLSQLAERFLGQTVPESNVWLRLRSLALAVEIARTIRQPMRIADLLARAMDLVQGVMSGALFGTAPAGTVSSLLLISEAAFRLGNLTVAAQFAGYARDFIDAGTSRVDPWGDRSLCAARIVLAADRERGMVDSVDAATALAAPQFCWRDVDFIAYTMAQMWDDFDRVDLQAAADRGAEALHRVTLLAEWPLMWFHQVWLAGLKGQKEGLRTLRERYLTALNTVGLDVETMPDRTPEVLRRMAHVTGGYVPSPNFVPVVAGPDGGDSLPRWKLGLLLLNALDAIRGNRRREARVLLTHALSLAYERVISPMSLVVASADEIRELGGLIADHPWAQRLNLDGAITMAGQVAHGVELSDREREVLTLLRTGMTNQQIADELYVSVNTAKYHRGNLMRKLGASTRQQLLEEAARLGL